MITILTNCEKKKKVILEKLFSAYATNHTRIKIRKANSNLGVAIHIRKLGLCRVKS